MADYKTDNDNLVTTHPVSRSIPTFIGIVSLLLLDTVRLKQSQTSTS